MEMNHEQTAEGMIGWKSLFIYREDAAKGGEEMWAAKGGKPGI